jgi:hypothetical protein
MNNNAAKSGINCHHPAMGVRFQMAQLNLSRTFDFRPFPCLMTAADIATVHSLCRQQMRPSRFAQLPSARGVGRLKDRVSKSKLGLPNRRSRSPASGVENPPRRRLPERSCSPARSRFPPCPMIASGRPTGNTARCQQISVIKPAGENWLRNADIV